MIGSTVCKKSRWRKAMNSTIQSGAETSVESFFFVTQNTSAATLEMLFQEIDGNGIVTFIISLL
jgi:hypothetical protein